MNIKILLINLTAKYLMTQQIWTDCIWDRYFNCSNKASTWTDYIGPKFLDPQCWKWMQTRPLSFKWAASARGRTSQCLGVVMRRYTPKLLCMWETHLTGDNHIMIRTVDTDVSYQFHSLCEQNPNADIWVGFWTGKQFNYYHINTICEQMGKDKSVSLGISCIFRMRYGMFFLW